MTLDPTLLLSVGISVAALILSLLAWWEARKLSSTAKSDLELHKKDLELAKEQFLTEIQEREAKRPRISVQLLEIKPLEKQYWPPGPFEIIEAKSQVIMVSVRNGSVTNLTAQVWINEQGPNYLEWRWPKQALEPPQMILSPGGVQEVTHGKLTIKMFNQNIDIIKGDIVPLLVWYAWKLKDMKDLININVNPATGFFCNDYPADTKVYLRIKFLADQDIAEGEDHHFALTIGGWDNLKLELVGSEDVTEIKDRLNSEVKVIPSPQYKPPEGQNKKPPT